jgi:hypothetical protein
MIRNWGWEMGEGGWGMYEPGDGEEGGLVAGEQVAGVEDDLRELEEQEGEVGPAGELGRQGVPFLVLLRDLRARQPAKHRQTFGQRVRMSGGGE